MVCTLPSVTLGKRAFTKCYTQQRGHVVATGASWQHLPSFSQWHSAKWDTWHPLGASQWMAMPFAERGLPSVILAKGVCGLPSATLSKMTGHMAPSRGSGSTECHLGALGKLGGHVVPSHGSVFDECRLEGTWQIR